MIEMQLDLIRQGKCPIQFGEDGAPIAAQWSISEMMRFLSALADGYMKLYNSKMIREKADRARRREFER